MQHCRTESGYLGGEPLRVTILLLVFCCAVALSCSTSFSAAINFFCILLALACNLAILLREYIYTYKREVCVCWFVGLLVCWFVCFLSATRHLSTLRRCLRVLREQPSRRGRPRPRARASMHLREHARACRTTSQQKIAALMPFKNN